MVIKKLLDGRLADIETGELLTQAKAKDRIDKEALDYTEQKKIKN